MAKITFSKRGGQIRTVVKKDRAAATGASPEEVVRRIKEGSKRPHEEEYRRRSLEIHGLVCARCGREFDHTNRHLLTVHHRDGNHDNNPPDGSNWENLCVYCHDDAHSREVLGDYIGGESGDRESVVVYSNGEGSTLSGLGSLGDRIRDAMKKKK